MNLIIGVTRGQGGTVAGVFYSSQKTESAHCQQAGNDQAAVIMADGFLWPIVPFPSMSKPLKLEILIPALLTSII